MEGGRAVTGHQEIGAMIGGLGGGGGIGVRGSEVRRKGRLV